MLSKAERIGRRSPVLLFSVSLLRAGCHTGVQRSRQRGLRLSHALHENRILQPGDSFTPPTMSTNTYDIGPTCIIHICQFFSGAIMIFMMSCIHMGIFLFSVRRRDLSVARVFIPWPAGNGLLRAGSPPTSPTTRPQNSNAQHFNAIVAHSLLYAFAVEGYSIVW